MSADGRTELLHRPPAQVKKYIIMPINSCKATKEINSFQYVAIPSPRDVFNRYGERLSNRGEYGTDSSTIGTPCMVSAGSTIDSIINAQHMLESDLSKG